MAQQGSISTEIENYLDGQVAAWQNPILLKDGVGKAKPTIYDIPANLTFGLTPPPDVEGAKEIVNVWQPHIPSNAEKDRNVDYLRWNRFMASSKQAKHINLDKLRNLLDNASGNVAATPTATDAHAPSESTAHESTRKHSNLNESINGNTNATVSDIDLAKDNYDRRCNKLNKLRQDKRKLLGINQKEKREIYQNVVKNDKSWKSPMENQLGSCTRSKSESQVSSPNFLHGRRKDERPPTPMGLVMGMEYARIGARASKEKFEEYLQMKKNTLAVKQSGPTKASLGHALGSQKIRQAREPVDDREKWCLSKFKRVKGTLSAYIQQGPIATSTKSDHTGHSASRVYM